MVGAVEFFKYTPGSLNGPSSIPNIITSSNIEKEKDRVDFNNYYYYNNSNDISNIDRINNNDTNNENNNVDNNNNDNNENNSSYNNKVLKVSFEVGSNDFQNKY